MKKRIIISLTIILILLSGIGIYNYVTSFHTVSFKLARQPLKAAIFKKESDQFIATISQDAQQSLQNGDYYIKPSGDNVDPASIPFTVTKEATVTIDPSYASDFLFRTLDDQIDDIHAALIEQYPQLISQFNIKHGKLLEKGEWYVTLLTYKNSSNDNPRDNYRAILHYENNEWKVVNKPEIVPTKYNFQTVPQTVLEQAQKLNPAES